MIECVYIVVGILFIFATAIGILTISIHHLMQILDNYREPYWRAGAIRKYRELALAFNDNKKIEYIFKTLADNKAMGWDFDTWRFKDEVEEKFGKNQPLPPQGK